MFAKAIERQLPIDPAKVARFGAEDRARLMADAGIVRNRLKVEAAIHNAQVVLDRLEQRNAIRSRRPLIAIGFLGPVLFMLAIAIWIGLCTAGAARYRDFRGYACVLAGYTAVIIGLPATLHPEGAFMSALWPWASLLAPCWPSSRVTRQSP